jgi:hypothetical protein
MVLTARGFGEISFSTGGVTTKTYESSSEEFYCFSVQLMA